jgi:hypothetical protein
MRMREIQNELRDVKIRVSQPPNQDLTIVLLTAYGVNRDGIPVEYYVHDMDWHPYRGSDILDVMGVALPGWIRVDRVR